MSAGKASTAGKKAGAKTAAAGKLRGLRATDLDAVIAIDRQNIGRSRRGFFEKRLEAVRLEPELFVTLGVEDAGGLTGFIFARISSGEFGTSDPNAAIDALGVDPANMGKGVGRRLMDGLEAALKKRGIRQIYSQELWTGTELMGYFAACGFELAPRFVLERPLSEPVEF